MPTSGRKSTLALLLLVAISVVLSGLAAQAESSFSGTYGTRVGSGSALTPDDITLGNAVATSCLGVTTCTTPALTNIDAGDTLIVIVTEHTTTAGNPSSVVEVTSGGNNPMTLLGSSGCTVLGHGVVAIYGLADVAAQASVTFTVTYAAAEYYTIHVLDVEGTSASPFETAGTPVCSSAAGTTASASVTTTVADDLVILGVEVRADEAISASGGDTVVTLQEIGGASSDSGSMLDEFDSGTGSITLSATFGSAQWAALAVALKPGLIAGVVSPATAAIDASQSVALTSTAASGGSGSYAYQWYNGSATCSSGTAIPGATTLAYTTPALPVGTDYYCVEATDSTTLQVAYSNVAVITVNPALSVTITPASPSIDSGQTITLTANPSGGTGADSYAWYSGATCSGPVLATTQSYTASALSSTTTFCVAATDSAYQPVTTTATDIVTVSSSSLSVTITPSAPSIDNGQSITLTANPSGGTGADTYAWYAGATCSGTVLATSQAYSTAALTASATYCVSVTDSAYQPSTATATDTVTVSAFPLSATITPASPSIDSGQNVTLTANPAGGTGTDSYQWYAGASCSGTVLAATQVYTTSDLGSTTTYCAAVTDSAYLPVTVTATDTITVSAFPLGVTITPVSPSIDSGQVITLTASPSGGTGSDSFAWYAGAGCSGGVLATTRSYATPALTLTSTYCVAVTDSAYQPETADATDTVTVSSTTLSVSIAPASPSIDQGQFIELTAHPSGGTGPETYAWYAGAACSGSVVAMTQSYTTPALTVTSTFCVAATDSSYQPQTATATDAVTVSGFALTVAISPVSPSIDSGQSVTLTAHPSGGTGADDYAWYAGSTCSGIVLARTQVYTSAALSATSTYCVAVTDSAYQPVTATATDTVAVSSSSLTVAITPAQPSIDRGQTITLTAEPSGGTGADSYAWYAGGTCSGSVIATTQSLSTPELNVSTTYCVTVTDSSAEPATATATATVTVTAVAPTGSGNGGGSGLIGILSSGWWLLLLLVIVMLLLLLLVARRRRKKEPPAPAAAGMPSSPAAGVGAAAAPGLPESPAPSSPANESPKNDEASESSSSVGSGASPPPPAPPVEAPVEPEPVPLGTPSPNGGGPEPTPAPPSPAPADSAPAAEGTAPGPTEPQSPAPEASAEPRTLGDWLFRTPPTEGEDPQE